MSGGQQVLLGVGGARLVSALVPGANPGGQAGFLGFSTSPGVGSLSPQGSVKGYNCAFISESQSGDAYIQVGFPTPSLDTSILTGVRYNNSVSTGTYAAPIYSGGQTIFAFSINQRSLVNGVATTFNFL